MPKPLDVDFGIFSADHDTSSACTYYRIKTPLRGIYDLGLANYYIGTKSQVVEEKHIAMLSADIVQLFSIGGPGITTTMEAIKGMKSGWNNDKTKRIYPPSIVFDTDDLYDYVDQFNPAFVRLGTRNYRGDLLKPGDALTTTFEKDGTVIPLWEDKKTIRDGETFDIDRNHKNVAGLHRIARRSDGVTVSSPALAKYYKEVLNCSDVHVYPNSFVPTDYPKPRLAPHEGVRILWQGGGSHFRDWMPLRDALREVALKYPQATFVIFGTAFKWVMDNIPEEQLEFHDWVPYDAYKTYRTIVDCDINLCPLVDSPFNRCKTAIKWYESVAPVMPEATLAANLPPYSDEMVDGETGLLYDDPKEFVEKLGILIENIDLRKQLAKAGRDWVIANRNYKDTAQELFGFYEELRAKKRVALEA